MKLRLNKENSRVHPHETHEQLLERAAMNQFQFNTHVVRGTDNLGRFYVTQAWDNRYGDCLSIRHRFEDDPSGQWLLLGHLSPARARVMAKHLLAFADALEHNDPGMKRVDQENS